MPGRGKKTRPATPPPIRRRTRKQVELPPSSPDRRELPSKRDTEHIAASNIAMGSLLWIYCKTFIAG